MEDIQKKVGRRMSMLMGVTVSFILSLAGTLMSGHFTPIGFVMSFIVATIMSLIIGLIIPMKKLSDTVVGKLKLTDGKPVAKLVSSLLSDIIYTPLIVLVMIAMNLHQANIQIDKSIENLNNEIAQVQVQIDEAQGDQSKIGPLMGKMNGMKQGIENANSSRPNFGQTYAKSLLSSFLIGLVVIYIIQPIYLKMTFKHYNIEV